MKQKTKHPKMDRHLIAAGQPYELDYVVTKMRKEGIDIDPADVIVAAKVCNNSRRKVYKYFRDQKHKG